MSIFPPLGYTPRDKVVDINNAMLVEIRKYQKGVITREQLDVVIKEKLLELQKEKNYENSNRF